MARLHLLVSTVLLGALVPGCVSNNPDSDTQGGRRRRRWQPPPDLRLQLVRGAWARPCCWRLSWYRAAFDSTWETRGPLRYYRQKFRKANDQVARAAPRVATPVLILWGQDDKYLMWAMAAESCKYVEPGKCSTHVFPDVSHWPHWDDPTGVVQRWRAFVAGAAQSGAGEAAADEPAADGASPAASSTETPAATPAALPGVSAPAPS